MLTQANSGESYICIWTSAKEQPKCELISTFLYLPTYARTFFPRTRIFCNNQQTVAMEGSMHYASMWRVFQGGCSSLVTQRHSQPRWWDQLYNKTIEKDEQGEELLYKPREWRRVEREEERRMRGKRWRRMRRWFLCQPHQEENWRETFLETIRKAKAKIAVVEVPGYSVKRRAQVQDILERWQGMDSQEVENI